MVEFALIFPLFLLLVFGSLEASAAFYARSTVGLATSDAARTGSIQVHASTSDQRVIDEVLERTGRAFGIDIQRIVIYKASDLSSDPPEECITGVATTDCAVYEPADFESASCAGGWCPSMRRSDDLLGVWVQTEFYGMSGMSPLKFTWRDKAVMLVEPKL